MSSRLLGDTLQPLLIGKGRTATVAADVAFLSMLVLSASLSALAITKFVSETGMNITTNANPDGIDFSRTTVPVPQMAENEASSSNNPSEPSSSGSGSLPSGDQHTVIITDADLNDADGNPELNEAVPLPPAGQTVSDAGLVASQLYSPIYESSSYILPITWGAVAGTLMWRGKVRSAWCKQGYDYDTFRLMARMKGSPIRVKLLSNVATAKNRLQLAKELNVDWKTIDNHIELLTKNGLIEEQMVVGTYRYYVITEHGRRILALLSALDNNGQQIAEAQPAVN